MNKKIIFANKTYGKINFDLTDLLSWKSHIVEEFALVKMQPETVHQHPEPVPDIKRGRGRPKKQSVPEQVPEPVAPPLVRMQPAPAPEPEPVPEPAPVPEPERKRGRPKKLIVDEVVQPKRRVGRPKKVHINHHHCSA